MYKQRKRKFRLSFFEFGNFFREHKFFLCLLGVIVIIAILTGIFSGIRVGNRTIILPFDTYSLQKYLRNELGTTQLFLTRLISCLFIMVLCSVTHFHRHFSFIGIFFLLYRAFLLGINITLLIILFANFGSILTVIIVVPIHLLMFASYIIFLRLISRNAKKWHQPFNREQHHFFFRTLCFVLIFNIVLCLLETLLLALFSSKIIIVI